MKPYAKAFCVAMLLMLGCCADAQIVPQSFAYGKSQWQIRVVDHGNSPLPGAKKCQPKRDDECYSGLTNCQTHHVFLFSRLRDAELKFTLWHELEHVITDCGEVDDYHGAAPAGRFESDIDTLFNDLAAGFGELFGRNESLLVFFFGERQPVMRWGRR